MQLELKKAFAFSACYTVGARALGRNYTLSITLPALDESQERDFERLVEQTLISKLHTRDIEQVSFLKGVPRNDADFLKVFWQVLSEPLAHYKPLRLELERDSRTRTTLIP